MPRCVPRRKGLIRAFTTRELRNGLWMRCYKKMLREVLQREVPPGVTIRVRRGRPFDRVRSFVFEWEDL